MSSYGNNQHLPASDLPALERKLQPGWIRNVKILVALLPLLLASCSSDAGLESEATDPPTLAFAADDTDSTIELPTITAVEADKIVPVQLGDVSQPFLPIDSFDHKGALITETGIVVPFSGSFDDGWKVTTVCEGSARIQNAQPLERPHVVLDAGHGGREPGAVSDTGLTEADLNLQVVRRTKELLEDVGASVVLTRTGDYEITTKVRAEIASNLQPGLFISVHHNGGALALGDKPGTIVFTKFESGGARTFGGLFYQRLNRFLIEQAAEPKQLYETYAAALTAHEKSVAAYDQSVVLRDQALVANGQVLPDATTSVPTTTPNIASVRDPIPTTTQPAQASSTVAVPDTLPIPPALDAEPVEPFAFSGGGNSGVRYWLNDDGDDYLGVLRHSGDVPAVLVEFLYLSNPAEARLLSDPEFVEGQARVLAEAIIAYFAQTDGGSGFVADQTGDQPIGNSGGAQGCVESALEFYSEAQPEGSRPDITPGDAGEDSTSEGSAGEGDS